MFVFWFGFERERYPSATPVVDFSGVGAMRYPYPLRGFVDEKL